MRRPAALELIARLEAHARARTRAAIGQAASHAGARQAEHRALAGARRELESAPCWTAFVCASHDVFRIGSALRAESSGSLESAALRDADEARGELRRWAALHRGLERRIAARQARPAQRHPWPD